MKLEVPAVQKTKIQVPSLFSKGGTAFDTVKWVRKDAVIVGADGKEKFRQNDVEVPDWWSDTAINIVAEKYFRVVNGVRETSAKQMFSRVAKWLKEQGIEQGVFEELDASVFEQELLYMLVHGMHAFNSPVWFNTGVVQNPQSSACFIQSVEDEMKSIMDLATREVMLFKGGSGTGGNLSNLRSSYECLTGGGNASGPVSFMRGFDAFAGATKSGGTTRRAAKMVVLNVDHPDILTQKNGEGGFVSCKSAAEKVAHDLYSTGQYTAEWNKPGNVYDLVGFQNANNSVRVTDEFMQAVEQGHKWVTKEVKTGKPVHTYDAEHVWEEIAKAAWVCGDPGIQFDTIVNEHNTCPVSGRINATNPCQPAWATVLTPEGIRTFSDIEVGSMIWSGKQWTKVVRKIFTGVKPVYRFYTRAGIFVGTEEHRVISGGQRVEARYAETIDTANGHLSNYVSINPLAVVDGLVFGDGYVKVSNGGKDHYPLLIIGENDQSYFEDKEIAEYINAKPFDKLSHRVNTTLTREELPRVYLRQVPARYFKGTESEIASFLRGLYSANGSVVSQRIVLKATSFTVIGQVQEMLSSIGIRSYYTTNKPFDATFDNGTYTSKESYNLNISTDRDAFARLIGFIQPYKQIKLKSILETEPGARGPKTSYEVVSVQLVGEEPVWDIEVQAEEHTYWTGGLLVSNCAEYIFLDDTACNLSSLNLLKFAKGRAFDIDSFVHACRIATISKEIIVDGSSYPSDTIRDNSHKYRTLGLGFTNLGALLTFWGLPYDSNEGRAIAGSITAIMGGAAQKTSAELAGVLGSFSEYEKNKDAMLEVVGKHWNSAKRLPTTIVKEWQPLVSKAFDVWRDAYELGQKNGYRNAQVTVIAPTGTISFLMNCDTTGIEPMLGVVVYKKVVGEGLLVLPNGIVEPALLNLGYNQEQIGRILEHIRKTSMLHTAPDFDRARHGAIFAEALGEFALKPEAHVDMMAAVQPFISGGISKTVNMPNDCVWQDIANIYMRAWKSGLKCIAVYRDGCKLSQPISTELTDKSKAGQQAKSLVWGQRKKLPETRNSITHKFSIAGHEGYLTAGMYEDGSLAEIFVSMAKQGSTLDGLVEAWAIAVSIALQHGVPLSTLVDKYRDMKFEPSGFTENPEIRLAKSIPDYLFNLLNRYFGDGRKISEAEAEKASQVIQEVIERSTAIATVSLDGPPCTRCGNLTKRSGSCYCCQSCGSTTGCS